MKLFIKAPAFIFCFLLLGLKNATAQSLPPANFAFPIGSTNAGYNYGYACTKDARSNTYVIGVFQGIADFDPSSTGIANLTSTGNTTSATSDIFIAKYDSTGKYKWAFRVGSGATVNNNNSGIHIVVDNAGYLYATGGFTGTADFNPSASVTNNLVSAGGFDGFLAKYDTSGNYQWAVSFGGTGSDYGQRIAYDAVSNSIFMTGAFSSTADFNPSAATANLVAAGQTDIFLAAYSAADGSYQWVKAFGGTGTDVVNGLVMDANRNIYLAGYFVGTVDFDPSSATTQNVVSNGNTDMFLAKYDLNGNYQWALGIGGLYGDQATALAMDNNGYLIIAGYAGGTAGYTIDLDPSPTSTSLKTFAVQTSREGVIAKYDTASGAYQWGNLCTGVTNHIIQPYALAVDASNNILMVGFSTATSTFDAANAAGSTITGSVANYNDGFTVKYNPDGSFQWVFDYYGYFTYPWWIYYDTKTATFTTTGGFQSNSSYPTTDFDPTSGSLPMASIGGASNIYVASYKDNKTWVGATGSWATTTNWSPSGVPTVYDHITIPAGSPTVTGTVAASSIIFNGTGSLVIPSSATLQIGGVVLGNKSVDATNGGVTMKGLCTQKISTGSFTSNTFKNLTIDNSYGVNITDKTIVSSALAITNGDSLYLDDTLQLGGAVTNTGKFNTANGTVIFNGTAAQVIPANTFLGNTVKNLVVNNAAGLSIDSDDSISNVLSFIAGKLTTGSNKLVILNGATVSGATSTAYVNGTIRKVGSQAFTFPVGDATKYAPIGISAPSAATDHFTANYVGTNPNSLYPTSSLGTGINHVSTREYWILNRTNGVSQIQITLSWDASRSGSVTNLTELTTARWNGSNWANFFSQGTTGTLSAGTIKTSTGVQSFGPFTLASTTINNPLPLLLISFSVQKQNNAVAVQWQTKNEINNDYFNVQFSTNGNDWNGLGKVNGKNAISNEYSFIHSSPINGKNYYRLQQVDKDGKITYSDLRTVDFSGKPSMASIYPNPVKGSSFTMDIGAEVAKPMAYSLCNALGKIVQQGTVTSRQQTIVTNNLAAGNYILSLGNGQTLTVVKQ